MPFLERATRLSPSKPSAWKALGLVLLGANDYRAASVPLGKACALDPNDEDNCYLQARSLFVLGQYDQARAALRKGTARRPARKAGSRAPRHGIKPGGTRHDAGGGDSIFAMPSAFTVHRPERRNPIPGSTMAPFSSVRAVRRSRSRCFVSPYRRRPLLRGPTPNWGGRCSNWTARPKQRPS